MSETWAYRMKEGDTVTMTAPTWTRRRWWQFWKPRWIEGPKATNLYTIGKVIELAPCDSGSHSKSRDTK